MAEQINWFNKVKVGAIECANRIIMAPLTRGRCDEQFGIPNDKMVKHYEDRADFGLIITEATAINQRGFLFPHGPGIYNDDMVEGWKKVTNAVHKKGGKIVLQIWHAGRITTTHQNGGLQPWAPSAIKLPGQQKFFHKDYELPHEMTIEDIQEVLNDYRKGAENAKKAGFDGIEVHAAFGYLIDTFVRDCSNERTDEYGGTIQKRCKFALEVVDQMIAVFGANRVGIRLSPVSREGEMYDSDPIATFSYLIKELDKKNIAFIDLIEPEKENSSAVQDLGPKQIENCCKTFKPYFSGIMSANLGFDQNTGLEKIQSGEANMIAFGIPSICNPDLVNRIRNGYPFNRNLDFLTLFSQENQGYNDYPTYEEQMKQEKLAQQNA